jgi:hypothetical protein
LFFFDVEDVNRLLLFHIFIICYPVWPPSSVKTRHAPLLIPANALVPDTWRMHVPKILFSRPTVFRSSPIFNTFFLRL